MKDRFDYEFELLADRLNKIKESNKMAMIEHESYSDQKVDYAIEFERAAELASQAAALRKRALEEIKNLEAEIQMAERTIQSLERIRFELHTALSSEQPRIAT